MTFVIWFVFLGVDWEKREENFDFECKQREKIEILNLVHKKTLKTQFLNFKSGKIYVFEILRMSKFKFFKFEILEHFFIQNFTILKLDVNKEKNRIF